MKKIIITGASRGIGKATAEKFLHEGWRVFGTSIAEQTWGDANFSWISLDLSKPSSIEQAAKDASAFGPFDVLVNNAGINDDGEDREGAPVDISALRRTLEVNLIGTIDFTERLIPFIKADGHIISLGSTWGSHAAAKGSAAPSYSISKAGLGMYTERLASRMQSVGTRVSIIHPGWVKTDMGGPEAPRTSIEAADEIYALAISDVPTGKFWNRGKEQAW